MCDRKKSTEFLICKTVLLILFIGIVKLSLSGLEHFAIHKFLKRLKLLIEGDSLLRLGQFCLTERKDFSLRFVSFNFSGSRYES